jgi:glycosyltransferase involved in cell wall biosynthesis
LKNHLIQVIEAWAPACELTVFGFYFTAAESRRWQEFAGRAGFEIGGLAPVREGLALRLAQAAALAGLRPLAEARYRDAGVLDAVQRLVTAAEDRGQPFDWVAHEVFHTLLPLAFRARTQRLLFPVDSYSLYYSRMERLASGPVEWLRSRYLSEACWRLERSYRNLDRIVTVAEPDAAEFRRLLPGQRIDVVPVAVEARRRRQGGGLARPRILVTGYLGIPTIARDTRLFLETWAAQEPPPAELIVWGRGGQRAGLDRLAREAGAEMVEWVDDYDEFLASGDVYVYPQRFACGVQTKVQQAMVAGLPVIAGPDVLGPLGARHAVEAWSVDGPENAARDLAKLLRDRPRLERIGAAAASLMDRQFSPRLIHAKLREVIGIAEPAGGEAGQGVADDAVLHC